MVNSRELLDAITAYQQAAESEHRTRTAPPEKSADEYADEAVDLLKQLIGDTIGDRLRSKLL